jgi:dTDP-4-amino-4,6-dideoxygalactose transaminase
MVKDYQNIVKSNWYTNFGPYEKKLSKEAAEYVSVGIFATTVTNCTLGLDLAISLLFDATKTQVLVPSFTFAAGPEMLIRNGFKPVFLDIEQKTWQMSIKQAENILSSDDSDIAGILLCNIFGVGNPKIDEWEALAAKYNKKMIVDSAAGFGSKYDENEIIGGRGDCEVFSLHVTKPFAVGEGGIITSTNEDFINDARSLQNFGFESDRMVHRIGTNAKMQEINCAIGIRQLAKLRSKIEKRQELLAIYKEKLEIHGFIFQANDHLSTVAFVSTLVPIGNDTDRVQQILINSSVEARRYYTPALHLHKAIMEHSSIAESLVFTEEVSNRIISLPLLNDMSENDIDEICNTLIGATQK